MLPNNLNTSICYGYIQSNLTMFFQCIAIAATY